MKVDNHISIAYTCFESNNRALAFRENVTLEAAVQRCPQEKVFWKYAASVQENTHAEVRFQ